MAVLTPLAYLVGQEIAGTVVGAPQSACMHHHSVDVYQEPWMPRIPKTGLQNPSGCKPLPREWIIHRELVIKDDVARDVEEASAGFASQPWASKVKYLGTARNFHVFARPPG